VTTPAERITRFRATPDISAFLKTCSVGELRQLTRGYRSSHGLQESDPADRGAKLGAAILQRLLADARVFGYERVRLDTAPFMHAAHTLYEAAGFVDCAPYTGSEVPAFLHPKWRFREKALPIQ
jgi:GNAT superfamily N-acetyltransferase